MKYFFFLALLFPWSILNSQTTTYEIDYSYDVGLGSSCNVFSTEKTINNFKHQTTKGFPNYIINTQIGSHINLACKRISSSSATGTDFQILFPFKKDYKYQIDVLYKSTYSSGEHPPMIGVKMNVTKKAHNTSVSCSGPQAIDFTQYEGQGGSGSSFAWPSAPLISTPTLVENHESLSIASLPANAYQATNNQGIQVRTVRIIEIAPPPPPIPDITGANTICSTATYSINVPSTLNVEWKLYPEWAATLTSNGNTVTINTTSYSTNGIRLMARIKNGTQLIESKTKSIKLDCTPSPTIFYIPHQNGQGYFLSGQNIPGQYKPYVAKVTDASLAEVAYAGNNQFFDWASSPVGYEFITISGSPNTGIGRDCINMNEQIGFFFIDCRLNYGTQYVLMYWEKNSELLFEDGYNYVTVLSNSVIKTHNDWNLRKIVLTPNSTTYNVTELYLLYNEIPNAYIQELRLHPVGATMETYTYDSNGNLKTKCDNDYNMTYY